MSSSSWNDRPNDELLCDWEDGRGAYSAARDRLLDQGGGAMRRGFAVGVDFAERKATPNPV